MSLESSTVPRGRLLENLQPSGSFKSRGIGNLMTQAAAAATGPVHFYCSSGGNAGLACATSALSLGQKATIVIPTIITELMKGKLLDLGVEVHQKGRNWAECDKYMREELLANDPMGIYVPPFDDPRVWDGAATMVDEIRDQLEEPIEGIVCSVGGGGLINGLMQGVEGRPWQDKKPAVVAVETKGADSLNMTSIATSLGATRVSEQTWKWSQHSSETMKSLVVSDADAAISAVRFADDGRHLVEVACGAALAPAYRGDLRRVLGQGMSDEEWGKKNVVIVLCGGSNVTLGMLNEYRDKYRGESSIKI
ncbi:hypothetical protein FOXB_17337 [Fusarium oxysporum f. sp. conglutinans Fo5176]|uniref:L-serine ammonia-lyase n=1 Tax=Fusarium oxysporum (strain Fo5176) TaxID=660025 RepID=F9GFA3_FUSOF|nr:hypothetical protein FOXB_17337 [Fusarium oxysporum f. sp. conglutinans Fo5176]